MGAQQHHDHTQLLPLLQLKVDLVGVRLRVRVRVSRVRVSVPLLELAVDLVSVGLVCILALALG